MELMKLFRDVWNFFRGRASKTLDALSLTWDESADSQEAIPEELAGRMREATQLKTSASENLIRSSSRLRQVTQDLLQRG